MYSSWKTSPCRFPDGIWSKAPRWFEATVSSTPSSSKAVYPMIGASISQASPIWNKKVYIFWLGRVINISLVSPSESSIKVMWQMWTNQRPVLFSSHHSRWTQCCPPACQSGPQPRHSDNLRQTYSYKINIFLEALWTPYDLYMLKDPSLRDWSDFTNRMVLTIIEAHSVEARVEGGGQVGAWGCPALSKNEFY